MESIDDKFPTLKDPFLTVNEVASKLHVSKRTIQRLIIEGEFQGIQLVRPYRLTEASVNDYLRRHAIPYAKP